MVIYNYVDVVISNIDEFHITSWIASVLKSEQKEEGEINYIFCKDDYLLDINKKFLNHNTLTDIISFDYSVGNVVSGDIYISTERVLENAETYGVDFMHELYRVMVHGILHYCGYKDKTKQQKADMRSREDFYLNTINI